MLYIDEPSNKTIADPISSITGWYATKRKATQVEIRLGGCPIRYRHIDRPDVEAAFPDLYSGGFTAVLDLSQHLNGVTGGSIPWSIVTDGIVESTGAIDVSPGTLERAICIPEIRQQKREWVRSRLCCPLCKKPGTLEFGRNACCTLCGTFYAQRFRAINLLPPQSNVDPDVRLISNISSGGYDSIAYDFIRDAQSNGSRVLDCGAGLRKDLRPEVITTEIVDYPSTDVLAVGEQLPFINGVFDVVFSFAVLEHVRDPFQCAREMMRVLKPGGVLYCHVPFLQPEHGFPDHYYNMTRSGLKNLVYSLGKIEQHWVPISGHPFYSLQWILNAWTAQLPEDLRERFRSMTVGDLIAHPVEHYLDHEVVANLSREGKWILASTTAMLVRKPA